MTTQHRHATYHDLQGKRAIVLACTAGIGRAVAKAMGEQGCHLALLSRNITKLRQLHSEMKDATSIHVFQVCFQTYLPASFCIQPTQCDVNDLDTVRDAVRSAIHALGGLDILVINTPGHTEATFAARACNDHVTCAQHHYTVNTLVSMAAYQAARDSLQVLFYMHMIALVACGHCIIQATSGAVVCISSIATQFTSVQDSLFGYSGAKAALEAWAAGVAVADGPAGVRINTVRPGVTVTAIWESARDAMGAGMRLHCSISVHALILVICTDPELVLATTASQTPLGCNASADDVAAAVLFLSSSASAFVTGTTITVDGGFSHMHPLCMSYLAPNKEAT